MRALDDANLNNLTMSVLLLPLQVPHVVAEFKADMSFGLTKKSQGSNLHALIRAWAPLLRPKGW